MPFPTCENTSLFALGLLHTRGSMQEVRQQRRTLGAFWMCRMIVLTPLLASITMPLLHILHSGEVATFFAHFLMLMSIVGGIIVHYMNRLQSPVWESRAY